MTITDTALDAMKNQVCHIIDNTAQRLIALSHALHARPELAFAEHYAHEVLTELLSTTGIDVVRGAHGLPTAFRADVGNGDGPIVAICCEYDALPDIGHACGHNIIGAAGVGAGIAVAALADELGGRVRILGTPAEENVNDEGLPGKTIMARDGAFDDVAAAVMIHPGDRDLRYMTTMACSNVDVTYHGKAAHAAASPWDGVNALDAAVLGYINVSAMRQQLAPDQRIHGTFTEVPKVPNIIAERAAATWWARGRTVASALDTQQRLLTCLQAGASAAGCEMDIKVSPMGSQVLDCDPLIGCYAANAARLGRSVADPDDVGHIYGSTDMGPVSRLVPALHAVIQAAPHGIGIHQRDFAAAACSAQGDKAVVDGAKALAMTVLDVWTNEELRSSAQQDFITACRSDPLSQE